MLIWRGRTHGHFSVVAVLLLSLTALLGGVVHAEEPQPRLAMGLIVKLKDAKPQSVVRLKASSVPSDNAPKVRQRLFDAARRHRVSYLIQRPTAFAAHVIHSGYPITVAEARTQAERLRADADVEWVIVNELERPAAVSVPNDPSYASQKWLQPVSAALGSPDFPAAWDLLSGRSLSPVVVAVLDSGVAEHADLMGRVKWSAGYDFVSEVEYAKDGNGQDSDAHDPGDGVTATDKLNTQLFGSLCPAHDSSWHGTRIAGELGAATDNLEGIAGILRPLSGEVVLPVRVGGKCGAAVSDIIEGMLWAAGITYHGSPPTNSSPARVINLSYGGDGACDAAAIANVGSTAWMYDQAILALRQKGALLIASAGNGDPLQPLNGYVTPTRPANCRNVLAVTALNLQGFKATYANFIGHSATRPGIATLGGDPLSTIGVADQGLLSTTNDGAFDVGPDGYAYKSGTSFAAPMVAGVAALMLAAEPTLSVDELIEGLTASGNVRAFPTGASGVCQVGNTGNCNCTTATCGAGVLDAGKAVNWAINHGPGTHMTGTLVNAPFFTPERLQPPARSSGGGGGSAGFIDLLWLSLVTALAAGFRQATPFSRSGRQINSGRP